MCTSTSTCSSISRCSSPSINDINVHQGHGYATDPLTITRSLLSRSTPALLTGQTEINMPVLMSDADMGAQDVPVSNLTSQLLAIAAKERFLSRRSSIPSSHPSQFVSDSLVLQPHPQPKQYYSATEGLSNSTSMCGLMGSAENSASTIQQLVIGQLSANQNSNYNTMMQSTDSRNTSMYAHQDSGEYGSHGTMSTNNDVNSQGKIRWSFQIHKTSVLSI